MVLYIFYVSSSYFQTNGGTPMESQEQELFQKLFSPHNRRDFIKRAGALGLSASALTAFLEACGSSTSSGTSTTALPQ